MKIGITLENINQLLSDSKSTQLQIFKGIEVYLGGVSKTKGGFKIEQTKHIPQFLSLLTSKVLPLSLKQYQTFLTQVIEVIEKSTFKYVKISSKLSKSKLISALIESCLLLLKNHSVFSKKDLVKENERLGTQKKVKISKLLKLKIINCVSSLIQKNSKEMTQIFSQEIVEVTCEMLRGYVNSKDDKNSKKEENLIYGLLKILKGCSMTLKNSQYLCSYSYTILLSILKKFSFYHIFVQLSIEILWNIISHENELKIEEKKITATVQLLFDMIKKINGIQDLEKPIEKMKNISKEMKETIKNKRDTLCELEYDIFTILLLLAQSKKSDNLSILHKIGFLKFICLSFSFEKESHYSITILLNMIYHFSLVEKYRKEILSFNYIDKICSYINISVQHEEFTKRFNPKQLSFIYLSILSILFLYIIYLPKTFIVKYTIPLFEFFIALNDEKLEEKTSCLLLECCRTKEGSLLLSEDGFNYIDEIMCKTFSLEKIVNNGKVVVKKKSLSTRSSMRKSLSTRDSITSRVSVNSKASVVNSRASVSTIGLHTPFQTPKSGSITTRTNKEATGIIQKSNNIIKGNMILIISWMCYYDHKNVVKFYELCGMKHLLKLLRNYKNKTEFCMMIIDCLENVIVDSEQNFERFIDLKGFDILLSLLKNNSSDNMMVYFIVGFILNILNSFKDKIALKKIIKGRSDLITFLLKKFIETREGVIDNGNGESACGSEKEVELNFEERIFLIFKNLGMEEGMEYLNLKERKILTQIKPFKKYIELRIWTKIKNYFIKEGIKPVKEDRKMMERRLSNLEELKVEIEEENKKIKTEIENVEKEKEKRFWNTLKDEMKQDDSTSKRHIMSRRMRRKITNKFLFYSYFSKIE